MNNPNLKLISPVAEVISISAVKQDKNGRNYKTLRLRGISKKEEIHGGIKVLVNVPGREVSINQYEESYLNGNPEPFYNSRVGDFLGVEIYTALNLEPYEIPNAETGEVREVTSYTFGVPRGENPMSVLNSRGLLFADDSEDAPFVEETDEVTANGMEIA